MSEEDRKFETTGEMLVQRPLEKEMRAGVPHFKPGQYGAVILEDDTRLIAALSWVNGFGHAVLMIVARRPGDFWEVAGDTAAWAGQAHSFGEKPIPDDFELNTKMIDVLNQAEVEWMEKFDGV